MKLYNLFIYYFRIAILVLFSFQISSAQKSSYEKMHAKNMSLIDQSPNFKHMNISSPAFVANTSIPSQYTCDGKNINPALEIKDLPEHAKSLALIVDDPDARADTWVHWLVWNIPVSDQIKENSIPGKEGLNDFQKQHYGGPCPPSGTHRYFFKVYALDTLLDLPESTDKKQLEKAMQDYVLGYGELIGVYKKRMKE